MDCASLATVRVTCGLLGGSNLMYDLTGSIDADLAASLDKLPAIDVFGAKEKVLL